MRKKLLQYCAGSLLFLSCSTASSAQTITSSAAQNYVPCQEMPNLIQEYNADYGALLHIYSAGAPDDESRWSGTGPGDSPEKRNRLNQLYHTYLQRLGLLDFNSLPQECKVDYILFKRDLLAKLQVASNDSAAWQKIKQWFPFADSIRSTERLRRRGFQLNAQQTAKDWYDITKQVTALEEQLKTAKDLQPAAIDHARQTIRNLQLSLKSIFEFYNGYDPLFSWWVPMPYKNLDSALTHYAGAFKKKLEELVPPDKSGIVGQPAGRDELVRQLKYEMIPYTPEELITIANKEFAWCDQEMLKASREMGFGDDWKAAMEKVKNTYVPAGKQPEAIYKLYNESIGFIKQHDLITIPPLAEETWGMRMMTPEAQLIAPFFLGGTDILISYPTNTMEENDRLMSMRGNNPHFSRATVHHELLAGHNLEYFMNERNRTYRNFDTPFWTEGWSLYWELLLWDLEFPQGPEDRIGMLFWHMHRCARIIFSLNYHLGKWTPQQCIDFLVDRVGHERANAAGEVRRSFTGHYPPLYQLAYLTGGRQFYALKHELVDSGKMSYKQFHDTIMHLNNMPVEMIRAILTNQPLEKEYVSKWRFYEGM
ncbi:DUF885 family protein [Deminuibacter soli]|uniref:DUF885 domain-containing protein n=1 Tax=Deminuibacter soli TaxID=2291815 RepID=A0A3E1NKW3_9BACT|nr:DUF885 family protein [Deminuibacter soli]RFM28575.1 DUF885 domain-containing protein [Deminuibacter soli]